MLQQASESPLSPPLAASPLPQKPELLRARAISPIAEVSGKAFLREFRSLLVERFTSSAPVSAATGVSPKPLAASAARNIANNVAHLARFLALQRGDSVYDHAAERSACELLSRGASLSELPENSLLRPLFAASRAELEQFMNAVPADSVQSQRQLKERLSSQLRRYATFAYSQGWSRLEGVSVTNPARTQVDWKGFPPFGLWYSNRSALVERGTWSSTYFHNCSSILHSFLAQASQTSGIALDRDSEKRAWSSLVASADGAIPEGSLLKAVLANDSQQVNSFAAERSRSSRNREAKEESVRSIVRDLYRVVYQALGPQRFPAALATALHLSPIDRNLRIGLAEAFLREQTALGPTRRVYRQALRRLYEAVAKSEKLPLTTAGERWSTAQNVAAANSVSSRILANPALARVKFAEALQLNPRYGADFRSSLLITGTCFLRWVCTMEFSRMSVEAFNRSFAVERTPAVKDQHQVPNSSRALSPAKEGKIAPPKPTPTRLALPPPTPEGAKPQSDKTPALPPAPRQRPRLLAHNPRKAQPLPKRESTKEVLSREPSPKKRAAQERLPMKATKQQSSPTTATTTDSQAQPRSMGVRRPLALVSKTIVLAEQQALVNKILQSLPSNTEFGAVLAIEASGLDPQTRTATSWFLNRKSPVQLTLPPELFEQIAAQRDRLQQSPFATPSGRYHGPLFIDGNGAPLFYGGAAERDRCLDEQLMQLQYSIIGRLHCEITAVVGAQNCSIRDLLAVSVRDFEPGCRFVNFHDELREQLIGRIPLEQRTAELAHVYREIVRASRVGSVWEEHNHLPAFFLSCSGDALADIW